MNKKVTSLLLSLSIMVGSLGIVNADSVTKEGTSKVVTMAADLTPQQKQTMFNYFKTNENEVKVIPVNNLDERKYLTGVAPENQIGTKTFSCAYIQPTKEGSGVNVQTANLTYVTAGMISSTLITAGVKDVNVLAASPFKVSGTGALTGCFLAFEKATGDTLDEEKKELATEEIVVTGDLGSQYSPEQATGMVNDMKAQVIKNGTSDKTQIADVINNVSNNYNITLTQQNKEDLEKLLAKIAEQDYDYKEVKRSLNHVSEGVGKQLKELGVEAKPIASGIVYNVKNFFINIANRNEDLGILEEANNKALGASAVIDSTEESLRPAVDEIKNLSIWEKIGNWFRHLFHKDEQSQEVFKYEENEPAPAPMPQENSITDGGDAETMEEGINNSQDPSPYPDKAPRSSELGGDGTDLQ